MTRRNYDKQPLRTAAEFTAAGYRRISNAYRIVSRIDLPVEQAAAKLGGDQRDKITTYIKQHGVLPPMWASEYRRVHSNDWVENLPESVYRKIPSSDNGED